MGVTKHIKDLVKEIEQLAEGKGFTSVEPPSEMAQVHFNDESVGFLDFTLRKGNHHAGRVRILVQNKNVGTQTVEQVGDIEFYDLSEY